MLSVSFRLFLITLALSAVSSVSFADRDREYTVFDVRKSLPLRDDEKIYRDYYINLGADAGARIGAVLAVYRKIPVIDIYRNKAQGDLVIPVAHVRIIHVQKNMSVARLVSVSSLKDIPVVDFEAVMTGDHVEFASAGGNSGEKMSDGDDGDDDDDNSPGDAVESKPAQGAAAPAPETKSPAAKPQPKKITSRATAANEVAPPGVPTQLPPKQKPKTVKTPSAATSDVKINSNI